MNDKHLEVLLEIKEDVGELKSGYTNLGDKLIGHMEDEKRIHAEAKLAQVKADEKHEKEKRHLWYAIAAMFTINMMHMIAHLGDNDFVNGFIEILKAVGGLI